MASKSKAAKKKAPVKKSPVGKHKRTFVLPTVRTPIEVKITTKVQPQPKAHRKELTMMYMGVKCGKEDGRLGVPKSLEASMADLMRRKCVKSLVGVSVIISATMVAYNLNILMKVYSVVEAPKKSKAKKK